MSDLIERQAAISLAGDLQIHDDEYHMHNQAINNYCAEIIKLPSAKPEMVKCKKCRYVYYDEEFDNYWCNRMSGSFKVEADGYCKWGK